MEFRVFKGLCSKGRLRTGEFEELPLRPARARGFERQRTPSARCSTIGRLAGRRPSWPSIDEDSDLGEERFSLSLELLITRRGVDLSD